MALNLQPSPITGTPYNIFGIGCPSDCSTSWVQQLQCQVLNCSQSAGLDCTAAGDCTVSGLPAWAGPLMENAFIGLLGLIVIAVALVGILEL